MFMNLCRQLLLPFLFLLPLASASASDVFAQSPRETIPLVTWEFVEDVDTNAATLQPPESADWKDVVVPHVFRHFVADPNKADCGQFETKRIIPAFCINSPSVSSVTLISQALRDGRPIKKSKEENDA